MAAPFFTLGNFVKVPLFRRPALRAAFPCRDKSGSDAHGT